MDTLLVIDRFCRFVGAHSTDVVLLNAGSLLIMAPTIIVFIIFQRFFVRAMLAGAVKG